MAFPLHAPEISDKSETGRETFSLCRIVTFVPVQKCFVPAEPKGDVFREGCDKKRHKLKKHFRVREPHILPRNVTNVTFFVTEKSDNCDVTHPNQRGEVGKTHERGVWGTVRAPEM